MQRREFVRAVSAIAMPVLIGVEQGVMGQERQMQRLNRENTTISNIVWFRPSSGHRNFLNFEIQLPASHDPHDIREVLVRFKEIVHSPDPYPVPAPDPAEEVHTGHLRRSADPSRVNVSIYLPTVNSLINKNHQSNKGEFIIGTGQFQVTIKYPLEPPLHLTGQVAHALDIDPCVRPETLPPIIDDKKIKEEKRETHGSGASK